MWLRQICMISSILSSWWERKSYCILPFRLSSLPDGRCIVMNERRWSTWMSGCKRTPPAVPVHKLITSQPDYVTGFVKWTGKFPSLRTKIFNHKHPTFILLLILLQIITEPHHVTPKNSTNKSAAFTSNTPILHISIRFQVCRRGDQGCCRCSQSISG